MEDQGAASASLAHQVDEYESENQSEFFEEEEEEAYKTDEEFDKKQFGIYQCLPIDDAEPDWESGDPTTVEEYLRRVRYESKLLPSVVTSDVDPRRYDDMRTDGYAGLESAETVSPDCPPELKPSLSWLRHFLAEFSVLRCRLLREHEFSLWPATDAASRAEHAALLADPPSAAMPQLEALKGLNQVVIVPRLQQAVRGAVEAPVLTPETSAQLYALSARLERPLHGDTAAAYRALLRRCREWRSRVHSPTDPLLPHLNILIALAGAYFRQDEELAAFWDEDEEDA